jgi:hypothetical protein
MAYASLEYSKTTPQGATLDKFNYCSDLSLLALFILANRYISVGILVM